MAFSPPSTVCMALPLLLLVLALAAATFRLPASTIDDLAQRASLQVSQICPDETTCRSDLNRQSCEQAGVCEQKDVCNGRTESPGKEMPLNDWEPAQEVTGCEVTSQKPDPPPSGVGFSDAARTLIVNGSADSLSACYVHRNSTAGEFFTLVFWLKADCTNCSVLEVPVTGSQSLHMRVVGDSFCIDTACTQNQHLLQNEWAFVVLRMRSGQLDIIVDVQVLATLGTDLQVENLYIGSGEIAGLNNVFQLYQVHYYRDVLTTRELTQLRTGLDDILDFPECVCPRQFPDLSQADDSCTDGNQSVPRFYSQLTYFSPDVITDGNPDTKFASASKGAVKILIGWNVSYQIDSIKMTFEGDTPDTSSFVFSSDGKSKKSHVFVCSAGICEDNLATLDANTDRAQYEQHVADSIEIILHRKDNSDVKSFVLSDLEIIGRCDCHGNAASCTVEDSSYTCHCDANTNTQGEKCASCEPNFFRGPQDVDCPNACDCDMRGVGDKNDQCEADSGECKCKEFVGGSRCDTCKQWTHGLSEAKPSGCTDCGCYLTGTLSCVNTTGSCLCKPNTKPPACDRCEDNYYGLISTQGCRPCSCNKAGTVGQSMLCDAVTGQCLCKAHVQGMRCEECQPGFYNLETANLQGCSGCDCHPVGVEQEACAQQGGQCPCRGGVVTDRICSPRIEYVRPRYGPEAGGTLVTIAGQLMGNDSHDVSVFMGNIPQEMVSVQDNAIVFRTVQHNTSSPSDLALKMSWANVDTPLTSGQFSYKPNPVADASKKTDAATFVSGGCMVKVYGRNLQSVQNPRLRIAKNVQPVEFTTVLCKHFSGYLSCVTPDLNSLYSSSRDQFEMTAILDGVQFTDIGEITVKPDPKLNDMGNIKFQYPFEDTIELSGKRLLSACGADSYNVLLGSVNCDITGMSDSHIECKPPRSPPDGQEKLRIKVRVGNIEKEVGTMEYLELYETTGFIIIISCIAGLILLVIGAIIICCCCRYRRRHASPKSMKNLESKELTYANPRPMNNYSELPSGANSNGTSNGSVRVETVFKEPKRGIINSTAETSILIDEFLPHVEPGLRDDIKDCYIGSGSFSVGRHCTLQGKQARILDGQLQNNGGSQKLTVKTLINPISGLLNAQSVNEPLPAWANLALSVSLRLRRHKHTHLLSILGIGVDAQRFYILYPATSGRTLKDYVADTSKEFSVRQLLAFSEQVAEGIDFLATKDITHKDIAARNCMIDDLSIVKVCDAAFSWDFYESEYIYDSQRERYLPVRWMSPESISDGYYDMRTDVWSFAILVWELLTRGCLPFHEVSNDEVGEYIMQGYILGKPETLSDDVYELLRNCWSPENESRPTIALVSRSLSEMLEAEDDGAYANVGAVSSLMGQGTGGRVSTPRGPAEGGNIYSTANLSRGNQE